MGPKYILIVLSISILYKKCLCRSGCIGHGQASLCDDNIHEYLSLTKLSTAGCSRLRQCMEMFHLLDFTLPAPDYGAIKGDDIYNVWLIGDTTINYVYEMQNKPIANELLDTTNCAIFEGALSEFETSAVYERVQCIASLPSQYQKIRLSSGTVITKYIPTITLFDDVYIYSPNENYASMPCPVGQWLTCVKDKECSYAVPINGVRWVDQGTIWFVNRQTPVGVCYSCDSGIGRAHYAVVGNVACTNSPATSTPRCLSDMSSFDDIPRMYCPGSDWPPMLCKLGSVANSARTGCVCEDGKYMLNDDCIDCPVAHFCYNNAKFRCPDHFYQDKTGQSSCNPCLQFNGIPFTRCASNQAAAQCTLANDNVGLEYLTHSLCVPCLWCKNKILEVYKLAPIYVDCYE